MSEPVALLAREARALVERLRLWTPARYAAACGDGTRGDVVHHLAASFAALAGAPVPLPRLEDLALADQLAVTADDLLRAEPAPQVARAAAAHLLLHRAQVMDEQVPGGLLRALGVPDEAGLRALAGCP